MHGWFEGTPCGPAECSRFVRLGPGVFGTKLFLFIWLVQGAVSCPAEGSKPFGLGARFVGRDTLQTS